MARNQRGHILWLREQTISTVSRIHTPPSLPGLNARDFSTHIFFTRSFRNMPIHQALATADTKVHTYIP